MELKGYNPGDFEWRISKEDYDNPHGKDYVYSEARSIAEQILSEWKKSDGERMVLLKAQMQCGKTSIIRHLCYLLNVEGHCKALGLSDDATFVLSHLNDNSLVQQTASRLEGVMIDPNYNVYHPAKRALKQNVAGNVLDALEKDRVLICDESHFGTGEEGRIDNLCRRINSPLWYDKASMKERNTFVLLISATPFAELGVNTEQRPVVHLLPGPAYWGIERMLTAGKIHDNNLAFFAEEATVASVRAYMRDFCGEPPGFVIFRENVHSKRCTAWMLTFKAVLDSMKDVYGYFDLNEETSQSPTDVVRAYGNAVTKEAYDRCRVYGKKKRLGGIDSVLALPPPKTIFIFIKEMLLAGKTLNTTHVRMVIDYPYGDDNAGNVDRIVQGLAGRCCGYGKNQDVVVITNKGRMQAYVDWAKHGVAPAMPATHARVQDGAELIAVKSAYVKPLTSELQKLAIEAAQPEPDAPC